MGRNMERREVFLPVGRFRVLGFGCSSWVAAQGKPSGRLSANFDRKNCTPFVAVFRNERADAYTYYAGGQVETITNGGTNGYLYDADGTRVVKGGITTWSCNPAAYATHSLMVSISQT
jgi:hypothetical protein